MRNLLIGFCSMAATAATAAGTFDGHPVQVRLDAEAPAKLFAVSNGTLTEAAGDGGARIWRWAINPGQTSELNLLPTHPLAAALRYYDVFAFEFRVAAGEINGLDFRALGQVSGAEANKAHEWHLAVRTTPPSVWHLRQLDLSRPCWYPWDDPDGEGSGLFRLSCLALAPGTVVELRQITLTRGLLRLKPDYEPPITWPVLTTAPDGTATYALEHRVLNGTGQPVTVEAQVVSPHAKFRVGLVAVTAPPAPETPVPAPAANASLPMKNQAVGRFAVSASLSAADLAALPELYEEPVRIVFSAKEIPEAECVWQSVLVRPLSPAVKRQAVLPPQELDTVRQALQAKNEPLLKAVGMHAILRGADEFLTKKLLHIPTSHQHPGSYYDGDWRPAETMPEAINTKTGEREFGTPRASYTWKMYFGYPGFACTNLGRAYLFTQDEKYAQKAVELFRLYARQYRELQWGTTQNSQPWDRAPVNLSSSRTAASSTYGSNMYFRDFCKLLSMVADSPSWTDADRTEFYQGFVLPYATEVMKFPGGLSNMTDITNHNVLLLGLACRDANLVRWALKSDPGLLSRLLDIDSDGFSSEGRPVNYQFAGMTEYLPSIGFLVNSGLPADFPRERLLAAVRMPFQRAALNGVIPNTGDCGRGQGARRNELADALIPLFPQEEWLYAAGATPLRLLLAGRQQDGNAWKTLLEPAPRLFAGAGMGILRAGTTAEIQVMATLDYGRNVFHAGLDRQQITLQAFGLVFTHGPGSLYNAGSGGITRSDDAKLNSFITHGSLSHNVIMIDGRDQLPAVGELLAWSAAPELQLCVSRVAGLQPGVTHTRGLVLTRQTVILLDRLESEQPHSYDFVYHNFGTLAPGPGWTPEPAAEPLGKEANYDNISNLQRLRGTGPLRLTWDLTAQAEEQAAKAAKKDEKPAVVPIHLALWQLPLAAGSEAWTGTTGLNNPNNGKCPDTAPSLFHRVKGPRAEFATVLEPNRGAPTVTGVARADAGGITVTWADGTKQTFNLEELCQRFKATK